MSLDAVSQSWVDRLAPGNPKRQAGISALRELLLRASRFEVNRRGRDLRHLRGSDQEDLAQQSADDALVAVLAKLDEFRGDSRFTTWSYKFALIEAATRIRSRAWQEREMPLTDESWALMGDLGQTPLQDIETREVLGMLGEAIRCELTPHQREVFVAVALNDVPIDVLAERLETTRGALYKTIYDARRKLRRVLEASGADNNGASGSRAPVS